MVKWRLALKIEFNSWTDTQNVYEIIVLMLQKWTFPKRYYFLCNHGK